MRRVLILGSPGSGKSTLAKRLSTLTGLPVVHLDQLYWRSGWVEPGKEEWLPELQAALAEPAWIMDGNYGGTLAMRLQHADTAVFLDFSTRLCLWRAIRRILTSWGRDRPDMKSGCPERIDFTFLGYIANFRRSKRAGVLKRIESFSGRAFHFMSPAQVTSWLQGIEPGALPPSSQGGRTILDSAGDQ
jgi:adenylate kinase family enzyme